MAKLQVHESKVYKFFRVSSLKYVTLRQIEFTKRDSSRKIKLPNIQGNDGHVSVNEVMKNTANGPQKANLKLLTSRLWDGSEVFFLI